jgi:death on curing protein
MSDTLSPAELLLMHAAMITRHGGMPGVTEAGFARLAAASAAPLQSAFGEPLYPSAAERAVVLFHAVVTNHPFSDGNKRVALAALDLLAQQNGLTLRADQATAYRLTMAAAAGIARRQAMADWLPLLQPVHPLELQQVLRLRDTLIGDDPQRFELINAPGLISALTTPFQAAFGTAAFPGLLEKAAALYFLLIRNHPFRDGNKRIAGAAVARFLADNGVVLQAPIAEFRRISSHLLSSTQLRDAVTHNWLARYSSTISL